LILWPYNTWYITWPSCGSKCKECRSQQKIKRSNKPSPFCMQIHSPLGYVLLTNLLKDCNQKNSWFFSWLWKYPRLFTKGYEPWLQTIVKMQNIFTCKLDVLVVKEQLYLMVFSTFRYTSWCIAKYSCAYMSIKSWLLLHLGFIKPTWPLCCYALPKMMKK
jgi:hypothetical protein